jgi:hypothetical protein
MLLLRVRGNMLQRNVYVCMEVFFLQKDKINKTLNILYFLVKRDEANTRCTGINYRKKEHYFEEECMEKMRETENTLRRFKEKDADGSRFEYWGKQKGI